MTTKIAIFHEVPVPICNGVTTLLEETLPELWRRGYEVRLVTPSGSPSHWMKTPVIRIQSLRLPIYTFYRISPFLNRAVNYLHTFRPDIIHLLNPFLLGLAGLHYALRAGCPIVSSFHSDLSIYSEYYGIGFISSLIRKYTKWIHGQCSLTMCPSRTILHTLRNRGYHRLRLWGRGVDSELFSPKKRNQALRRKLLDGDNGKMIALYVGRLAREKNIELLHAAFGRLDFVRTVIVGDGPHRATLERLFASDNVAFLGEQTHEDLAYTYASADVLVFPSTSETFGQVVLEAMASGLPAIAIESPGVTDLVAQSQAGILCDSDYARQMREALLLLRQNPPLRHRLGQAGREFALEQTWVSEHSRLIACYKEAMELENPL